MGGVRLTVESMRLYGVLGYATRMETMSVPQKSEAQDKVMKLHLAERDPQHHAWPKRGVDRSNLKLRILLSYWYYKDVDLDALFAKYFTEPYPDVFADSGGFSAHTQGVAIDWQEYAAWLKRWRHLFTAYANLDVIGNHAATMANQRRLESVGLQPLPVFHVGSDYADLKKLVGEYQYIALGGLVPYMRYRDKVMPHLIRCFRIAKDKAVFHGFGVTSWEVLKALPWYSVDSSSWGQGFRYGDVPVFDSERGRFVKLGLGNRAAWRRHGRLVRRLGFEPLDFADRNRNDRAKICAISALSYMLAEQWLRQRHGEIRIPGSDAPEVLRAHLVTAADGNGEGRGGNMSVAALGQSCVDDGLKLYGAAGNIEGGDKPLANMSLTSRGLSGICNTDAGVKVHLADSPFNMDVPMATGGLQGMTARDIQEIKCKNSGFKLHLAEHSLDRGGVGDISRAIEVLNENCGDS